jgi:hypothetical protein
MLPLFSLYRLKLCARVIRLAGAKKRNSLKALLRDQQAAL